MKTKELEAYLWGAANLLRGLIDAADFKQYIFPLLFFKRISDLWDEEYKQALAESGGDLTYAEFQVFKFQKVVIGKMSERKQTMSARLCKRLSKALKKPTLKCCMMSLAMLNGQTNVV
jgi:type I restriction-modification system DNA methylase subunit